MGTKIVQKLSRVGRSQMGSDATPSRPPQRMRQMMPVTRPNVSGVTHSARSQPGRVKRRIPRAGGLGGA